MWSEVLLNTRRCGHFPYPHRMHTGFSSPWATHITPLQSQGTGNGSWMVLIQPLPPEEDQQNYLLTICRERRKRRKKKDNQLQNPSSPAWLRERTAACLGHFAGPGQWVPHSRVTFVTTGCTSLNLRIFPVPLEGLFGAVVIRNPTS